MWNFCSSVAIKSRALTIVRRPAPLLPSLVQITAGAHEAADHGGNDGHEQEDGGGDASQSCGAEMRERTRYKELLLFSSRSLALFLPLYRARYDSLWRGLKHRWKWCEVSDSDTPFKTHWPWNHIRVNDKHSASLCLSDRFHHLRVSAKKTKPSISALPPPPTDLISHWA